MRVARSLVAAAVVAVAVFRHWRDARLSPARGELRYRVPNGQDPAAVLASLRVEGLSARPEHVMGEPVVIISANTPGARERVREILREAPLNMEGDPGGDKSVAFTDEN